MDTNDEKEVISENKIYEGIFEIFEIELEEISRFVALTSSNMNVYSNKIHELHLRVCSEIENILKIIIHKHFVSEKEVKKFWETDKSFFLEKKKLTAKYEELKNELDSDDSKKLDKYLFGFPDFAYYFKIACERFNLHEKTIDLLRMVFHNDDWEIIQPFEIEGGQIVPLWWTNYNKLKHNKIEKFESCTLRDLIYSISGLFILMNYLLKYRDRNLPIEDGKYKVKRLTTSLVTLDSSFCSLQSKFFQAKNTSQNPYFSFILPKTLTENDYQNIKFSDLVARINIKPMNIAEDENTKLADIDLKSFDYSVETVSLAYSPENITQKKGDRLKDIKHSLYYIYLDYEKKVTFNNQPFRELTLFARFIN